MTMICLGLGGIFLMLGFLFLILGEKGAMLISGFNTLSKAERAKYDKKRMSADMRNCWLLWGTIGVAGGGMSHFLHPYAGGAALVLLAVLFFREVHVDEDKAFGKYRL